VNNISIILPSRNNLKYLTWSYKGLRNASKDIEICVASDYSNDGTEDWCKQTQKTDENFKFIINDGSWFGKNKNTPSRMGHTLLYDILINEVSTKDIVMIYHADMWPDKNMFEIMLSYLKEKTVISATRIEPPLHPSGPEKLQMNFGTEPSDFDEKSFSEYCRLKENENKGKFTEGIFAPWMIYKKDFVAIGGHDPIFAPQSREDSDIFNRFILAGYKTIQPRDAYVYHLTCRGSRFNPMLTKVGTESEEWKAQNIRSERNFYRKWGSSIRHDSNLKPIIINKYDIGIVVHNCYLSLLYLIEPFCSHIYVDCDEEIINGYVKSEQKNTTYNLSEKIKKISDAKTNNIIVEFDAKQLTQESIRFIGYLSEIISNSGEIGKMEFEIFDVTITSLETYQNLNTILKK